MPAHYYGRKWDAPLTDDATPAPLDDLPLGVPCDYCSEAMVESDDLLMLPHLAGHTECLISAMVGDVQHLERRCICFRTDPVEIETDNYATYRERSKAALQWLIDNKKGRFHE